jgi:hypothetical protein
MVATALAPGPEPRRAPDWLPASGCGTAGEAAAAREPDAAARTGSPESIALCTRRNTCRRGRRFQVGVALVGGRQVFVTARRVCILRAAVCVRDRSEGYGFLGAFDRTIRAGIRSRVFLGQFAICRQTEKRHPDGFAGSGFLASRHHLLGSHRPLPLPARRLLQTHPP